MTEISREEYDKMLAAPLEEKILYSKELIRCWHDAWSGDVYVAIICMFGVHMEDKPNRFQLMKETHPKHWAYCINKLGLKEVLEYIGEPYEM